MTTTVQHVCPAPSRIWNFLMSCQRATRRRDMRRKSAFRELNLEMSHCQQDAAASRPIPKRCLLTTFHHFPGQSEDQRRPAHPIIRQKPLRSKPSSHRNSSPHRNSIKSMANPQPSHLETFTETTTTQLITKRSMPKRQYD